MSGVGRRSGGRIADGTSELFTFNLYEGWLYDQREIGASAEIHGIAMVCAGGPVPVIPEASFV